MRAEIEAIVGAAALDEREVRERLRGNPDGSLCAQAALRLALLNAAAGASRAPALFPAIGWPLLRIDFSSRCVGVNGNKVMAGGTPANPAALVSVS
jgi:hypothetical protein